MAAQSDPRRSPKKWTQNERENEKKEKEGAAKNLPADLEELHVDGGLMVGGEPEETGPQIKEPLPPEVKGGDEDEGHKGPLLTHDELLGERKGCFFILLALKVPCNGEGKGG